MIDQEGLEFDIWKRAEQLREQKNKKRKEDLESGKVSKIRVDRNRLNAIQPILHFYCAKNSSVFRDQAIENSDIDGGVVVVEERNKNKEKLFLKELDRQGFRACHYDDFPDSSIAIQFVTQNEFNEIDWAKHVPGLDTSKEVGIYSDK